MWCVSCYVFGFCKVFNEIILLKIFLHDALYVGFCQTIREFIVHTIGSWELLWNITLPPCNLQRDCSLLEVGKIIDISTHMEKVILEGVRRYGFDSLGDGVSGLLCGIGKTEEFCCRVKDIIIRAPSLDYEGCTFDRIGSFNILFYPILFYPILVHNGEMRLLYCSHADTWWVICVKPESIIPTWSVVET